MKQIKVLAICGSLRAGSYNRKLLAVATKIVIEAGVEVNEFDLKQSPLPIYDQDIEDRGLPGEVKFFKLAVENADLLMIASPEYNYSIPGGLKNAIDWASRGGNSFDGKVAAIFGVSNGPYGTVRMQHHLRQSLTALNVLILPQPQIMVRFSEKSFNPDGSLVDAKTKELLQTLIVKSIGLAQKIKS